MHLSPQPLAKVKTTVYNTYLKKEPESEEYNFNCKIIYLLIIT